MNIFNNLYSKFLFSMLALQGDILTLPLMFCFVYKQGCGQLISGAIAT